MRRGIRAALPLAAGVFLLLAWGLTPAPGKEPVAAKAPVNPPEGDPSLGAGDAAPACRLPDVNGTVYSLGKEGGKKPFLLAFFSVFCAPCRADLSTLQKIQEKYGGDVDVAAVSLDGKPLGATVAGFAKQEGYTFRILLDETGDTRRFRVADAYGVMEMPTLFLVDGRGRVALAVKGRVTEDMLEKAVREVLKK